MIIPYETLQTQVGGRTPAEVAARLAAAGIRCIRGKNGKPWTTIDAINAALGITDRPAKREQPEIEIA